MSRITEFFKKQTVLCIAAICAGVSMLFILPDKEYAGYINYSTLILLFSLMAAVAGLRKCGVFTMLSTAMISRCSSLRMLVFVMMNICFFTSMFITNDVALLTFVPVTVLMFERAGTEGKYPLIISVIIETAAANLGSMLLPTGNPQNIYICSNYSLTTRSVILTLLPYGIAAYVLLSLSVLMIPKTKLEALPKGMMDEYFSFRTVIPCVLIFAAALLTVSGVISEYICLAVSLVLILTADYKLVMKVDYALLLTFVCFFIFTGNIGRIDAVREFLSETVQGKEIAVSVLASQVISNVPAAILLSAFTQKAKLLLIGTNLGGLGTPVASLASLISYKLYSTSEGASGGRFMRVFFAYNMIFLGIMFIFSAVLN